MLQREGDVRGGTSAQCYKEKVMSEEVMSSFFQFFLEETGSN